MRALQTQDLSLKAIIGYLAWLCHCRGKAVFRRPRKAPCPVVSHAKDIRWRRVCMVCAPNFRQTMAWHILCYITHSTEIASRIENSPRATGLILVAPNSAPKRAFFRRNIVGRPPLHAESTSPLPIVEAATSAPPNALAPRQAQPHSTSTECLYTWTLTLPSNNAVGQCLCT